MGKHTPGPWHVNDGKGCRWIETSKDDVIARIYKDACSRETFDANASLIAAAPELLEALILLEAEMVASGNANATDFGWPLAIQKTRAAIAKATGEAQ